MKLATTIKFLPGHAGIDIEHAHEAERLGFDALWAGEAYGSDAVSPVAWVLAQTSKIKAGTSILQIPARTPACAAMTAMTLQALSGNRFLLGVGPSGAQVIEGWHGVPFGKPLTRTREYVAIIRQILERKAPLEFHGDQYDIPYRGPGATGLGKPLRSILHPYREEIPVYLGAEGPKNVALAAEIADGWNTIFFSPAMNDFYAAALAEGWGRPGARHTAGTFDVVGGPMRVIVDDDVERAADLMRPSLALYIGGMGARNVNFHREVFARMGYEGEAEVIQDRYLAGDRAGAIAAVPTKLVEDVALIGPWAKIAHELPRWRDTVLTTFQVSTDLHHLDRVVGLLRD